MRATPKCAAPCNNTGFLFCVMSYQVLLDYQFFKNEAHYDSRISADQVRVLPLILQP